MDQPPAVALTAFADAWPRATETEIGAALCAIRRGKDFDLTLNIRVALLSFEGRWHDRLTEYSTFSGQPPKFEHF